MTKSDDDVLRIVEGKVRASLGYMDTTLSQERQTVQRYYDGVEPKPLHKGDAKYVSKDVLNAVESAKANLLETFSGERQVITFAPNGPEDVDMAEVATTYTAHVIHDQNPGVAIFEDAIHDGLVARFGVVQVYWEKREEKTVERFEGWSQDDMLALIDRHPDLEIGDDLRADEDGTLSGSVTFKSDLSQVVIENVPPEEVIIGRREADPNRRGAFKGRRTRKTVAELVRMGFRKEDIAGVSDDAGADIDITAETAARFEKVSAGDLMGDTDGADEDSRRVWFYDTYGDADFDGQGVRVWNVAYVGRTILKREPVTDDPFVFFTPLRRPHSAVGSNFADRVRGIQNAKTLLTRSVINHALVTNNPRYVVVKGGLVNPREAIDNRFGGIINTTRPDAITPMQQAGLNPFVFQTVQMMDADKEDVTGVSRLAQGLNKDAVSKQNSADMVGQLTSLSMQRAKVMARSFTAFLKALYLKVYAVVIANENRERVYQVAGQWVAVTPGDWRSRTRVSTETRVGYGEADKDAQETLGLYQFLSQDPALAGQFGPEQRYALVSRYLKQRGIRDPNRYLLPQPPPPQPDPMVQANLEQVQATTKQILAQAETMQAKQKHEETISVLQLELARLKAQMQDMQAERLADLKEREQDHLEATDKAELKLAEQAANEPGALRAIASPSG